MQAPFHHSPGGAARPRVRLRLHPTSLVATLALLVTLLAAVGPAARPVYAQSTTTVAGTTTAGTTTATTVAFTLTPVIREIAITGDFSQAPAPLTLTALPLTTPPQTISIDAGSVLGLPVGSYGGCRA